MSEVHFTKLLRFFKVILIIAPIILGQRGYMGDESRWPHPSASQGNATSEKKEGKVCSLSLKSISKKSIYHIRIRLNI